MDYMPDDLEGEAPCEFCGELYPFVLLIEHQSIHMTGGDEDYAYLNDLINQDEITQNVIAEDIGLVSQPEGIVKQSLQSPVKNEPIKIVEQLQQSPVKIQTKANEASNIAQNLGSSKTSNENIKAAHKRSSSESSDQIVYNELCKSKFIRSSRIIRSTCSGECDVPFLIDEPNDMELVDDDIAIVYEASVDQLKLKDSKTFPDQKGQEFTTEKGEKLLVYGDEIDPDKDLESDRPVYKMPNNPLLSCVSRNEVDVEDINNLSDDNCDESLEEFWKRARDFLKRNRAKND